MMQLLCFVFVTAAVADDVVVVLLCCCDVLCCCCWLNHKLVDQAYEPPKETSPETKARIVQL